jgi:uncharacterized protein YjdB
VIFPNRIVIALPLMILGLAGCGFTSSSGGFPNPGATSISVSVNPSSITVAAGTTTTFAALFTPTTPGGGSLTWAVDPANGGTITTSGVYTASGTAGNYSVIVTWTPSGAAGGKIVNASATVEVLPAPQLGAELTPNQIQSSGTVQASNRIQNAGIIGQLVPSVTSMDSGNNVQVRSGFTIPVECTASGSNCP